MDPQQLFERELARRLRDRAALILSADQAVIKELQEARAQILQLLAAQPAEWQQWQLTQLLQQLQAVLDGATGRATSVTDTALRAAWQQGEDFVDKPLVAAGVNLELQLPVLDAGVLAQLRQFTALRLKDVGVQAARRIGNQLSLVTLGAATPFNAIKSVQQVLGNETPQRATTIVRTEVGRAFAIASFKRLQQSAQLDAAVKKQWRRSGKIHSRWNHDAADGQVRPVSEPFVLPGHQGTVRLMHPHDPNAPAEEVINCGCLALPFRDNWKVMQPGAKPFTERELRLYHRKATIDQAAKRAGMRPEPHPEALPGHREAVVPMAKLTGYALNPEYSPAAAAKARAFESVLGFTRDNADDLHSEILRRLPMSAATQRDHNGHGWRWQVDMPVTGPKGTAIVRTGWIVLDGAQAPTLTSAYIRKTKK